MERMKSMSGRKAVHALVDEHERALHHLMTMMNRWPDEALDRPVTTQRTARDLMLHIVDSLFAYFGWVRQKMEHREIVSGHISRQARTRLRSASDWQRAISLNLPYFRE